MLMPVSTFTINAPSLPVLPLLTCAQEIVGIQTTTPSVIAIRGDMPRFIVSSFLDSVE
jgi:hypothetical protein